MPETKSSMENLRWVVGAALILIGVFVVIALVMLNSQAVNVSTSATVNNVLPTVSSVFMNTVSGTLADNTGGIGGSVTLTAGANTAYYFNGVVTDQNGDADIDHVEITFKRNGAAGGYACTADKNDCYKVNPCTLDTAYGSATEAKYICQVNLAYWTDSTSAGGPYLSDYWFVEVRAYDEGGFGSDVSLTKEIATLLALNIQAPAVVDYGTRPLGSTTTAANNTQLTYQQYGNDEADVEVSSAAAMSCSVRGTIPVANQQWSLTDIDYGAVGTTALSGTPADTGLAVTYRTDEFNPNANNKLLYWNILIPATGVEGACTGTTVSTAIAA
jgi:hypothetical protein